MTRVVDWWEWLEKSQSQCTVQPTYTDSNVKQIMPELMVGTEGVGTDYL